MSFAFFFFKRKSYSVVVRMLEYKFSCLLTLKNVLLVKYYYYILCNYYYYYLSYLFSVNVRPLSFDKDLIPRRRVKL